MEDAEEAFEVGEDSPLDTTHRGAALEEPGQMGGAASLYKKGHTTGDPHAACRLGVLRAKQGDAKEARDWYRKAADMGHPAAKKALDENPDTVKE